MSQWHALQLKLPILGVLVKMINVSRFCSTLGTLMNSGVPILTALTIVKNLIPNVHMKDAVEKARQSVSEGASLAQPLAQSGYFPPLVTHMIKLGERSGELEPMLKIISENYEDQVQSRISGLTSVLEHHDDLSGNCHWLYRVRCCNPNDEYEFASLRRKRYVF